LAAQVLSHGVDVVCCLAFDYCVGVDNALTSNSVVTHKIKMLHKWFFYT